MAFSFFLSEISFVSGALKGDVATGEWVFQLCPRRDLVNGPTGEATLFVVVCAGMDFNRFSIEADSASSKTIYSLTSLTLQILLFNISKYNHHKQR